MKLPFVKMQGTGNSFIVVEENKLGNIFHEEVRWKALAQKICSLSYGVGADGLVILNPLEAGANFSIRIYNADGTTAEMCGNAIRCLAKYVVERQMVSKRDEKIYFQTSKGCVKETFVRETDDKTHSTIVTVNMGLAFFEGKSFVGKSLEPVEIDKRLYWFVSMDNPHAVTFVKDFDFDYCQAGRQVETCSKYFPDGVNVEYIMLPEEDDDTGTISIGMRVWERGVGETLSCGTGACAATVLSLALNKIELNDNQSVKVQLAGGELFVEWKDRKDIFLTGACEILLEGDFLL